MGKKYVFKLTQIASKSTDVWIVSLFNIMNKAKLVFVDYLLVAHLRSNDVFFDKESPDTISESLKT